MSSGIRMPNALLAQKDSNRKANREGFPENAFPIGKIIGFHEYRISQLEKAKGGDNDNAKLESKFTILSKRMDRLAKLYSELSKKMSHDGSEEDEDEDEAEEEGLVLEVQENK